jgi:hypothetical protein
MREVWMAGILDDLVGAVGAVAAASQGAPPPATTSVDAGALTGAVTVATTTESRLAAMEQAWATWGPIIEKLAPLLEKLEAL